MIISTGSFVYLKMLMVQSEKSRVRGANTNLGLNILLI